MQATNDFTKTQPIEQSNIRSIILDAWITQTEATLNALTIFVAYLHLWRKYPYMRPPKVLLESVIAGLCDAGLADWIDGSPADAPNGIRRRDLDALEEVL